MGQSPKISSRLSQDLINGALRDAYDVFVCGDLIGCGNGLRDSHPFTAPVPKGSGAFLWRFEPGGPVNATSGP
jgi:hypothetical protein